MIMVVLVTAIVIMAGLSLAVGLYRHRHTRPTVYHVNMAEHLWQPGRHTLKH